MAISSPLLETSIAGARGVLINITGSMDIGLEEVEQAASLVQEAVHPDALTIFGATFDETLDDEIRVTVIATGFDKEMEAMPVAPVSQAPVAAPVEPVAAPAPVAEPATKLPGSGVQIPQFLNPEEKVEEPAAADDDLFGDILKIFSKRD